MLTKSLDFLNVYVFVSHKCTSKICLGLRIEHLAYPRSWVLSRNERKRTRTGKEIEKGRLFQGSLLQQIITVLVPSIGDGIGKIRTLHLVAIKK
jgi:hypothetical protein